MSKVNYGDALLKIERMVLDWHINGWRFPDRREIIIKYALKLMKMLRSEKSSEIYQKDLRRIIPATMMTEGGRYEYWNELGSHFKLRG